MSLKAQDGELTVRWREDGRHRSRTVSEAELIELLRDREAATVGPTIYELACEWWEAVGSEKAPSTQTLYRWLLDSFVMGLKDVPVNDLTPAMVEDWNRALDTGPVAKGKAQTLLGQIIRRAVKDGVIAQNPVDLADRPTLPAKDPIKPPSVIEVERLRAKASPRDGMAIGLMAYAGLAPVDAFAALRGDWMGGVLSGTRKKSGERYHVPLERVIPTVADELETFATPIPPENPIVGPRSVAHWRKSVFYDQLGAGFNPYRLRHLAVSLWLRDPEVTDLEAASWAGHSRKQQDNYAHIISQGPQRAEDAVRAARRVL